MNVQAWRYAIFRAKTIDTETEKRKGLDTSSPFCGRGDRIRTCGLYVPNVALYQAEPHLDDPQGAVSAPHRPTYYSTSAGLCQEKNQKKAGRRRDFRRIGGVCGGNFENRWVTCCPDSHISPMDIDLGQRRGSTILPRAKVQEARRGTPQSVPHTVYLYHSCMVCAE